MTHALSSPDVHHYIYTAALAGRYTTALAGRYTTALAGRLLALDVIDCSPLPSRSPRMTTVVDSATRHLAARPTTGFRRRGRASSVGPCP